MLESNKGKETILDKSVQQWFLWREAKWERESYVKK